MSMLLSCGPEEDPVLPEMLMRPCSSGIIKCLIALDA